MVLFFINDIFFALKEVVICNFVDDTTFHVCDSNLKTVSEKSDHSSELAIYWIETILMKLNTDKCHLLFSGSKHEHVWVKIGQDIVWKSNIVKLLGVTIDNYLKFDNYVTNIRLRANRKLSVLARATKCFSLSKKEVFFLKSSFY